MVSFSNEKKQTMAATQLFNSYSLSPVATPLGIHLNSTFKAPASIQRVLIYSFFETKKISPKASACG
jgi:hypothetical protein